MWHGSHAVGIMYSYTLIDSEVGIRMHNRSIAAAVSSTPSAGVDCEDATVTCFATQSSKPTWIQMSPIDFTAGVIMGYPPVLSHMGSFLVAVLEQRALMAEYMGTR